MICTFMMIVILELLCIHCVFGNVDKTNDESTHREVDLVASSPAGDVRSPAGDAGQSCHPLVTTCHPLVMGLLV